jgi:thiamine-phosphate pyrophosphorylase
MGRRHPALPARLLVSDARNDAVLEAALARLPRGCGLIFRHYHLPPAQRRARFARLLRVARRHGHAIYLSGDVRTARKWGADGAYGAPDQLTGGPALPRLMTVHSLHELRRAGWAAAVVVSPVFATRSHPDARPLGPVRFRLIVRHARVPVIALGGMTPRRARALDASHWAAIDGLSPAAKHRIPKDS